jgi:hypothetical protein
MDICIRSPISCEEFFIFLLLKCIQLVEVLVLESVLVRSVLRSDQSLLNKRFRIFGFLWNNAMLAEDIVPILY